jgi:hypothetical protein
MQLQTVLCYYDFYNIIFKIKHKLHIASGSAPHALGAHLHRSISCRQNAKLFVVKMSWTYNNHCGLGVKFFW